ISVSHKLHSEWRLHDFGKRLVFGLHVEGSHVEIGTSAVKKTLSVRKEERQGMSGFSFPHGGDRSEDSPGLRHTLQDSGSENNFAFVAPETGARKQTGFGEQLGRSAGEFHAH